jgi:ParB-like chromosome segregation protein Spo0J
MAVEFAHKLGRGGALYTEYPENILIMPELNGRVDSVDVTALAADILKNGQIQPVLIRKDDQGRAVIVSGHCRWKAVKYINEKLLKEGEQKVKLECSYEKLDEKEAFFRAIAENRFRQEVSHMDNCHNILILQKRFKLSMEDIAGIYFPEATKGKAKEDAIRWVSDRAALKELAPEAEEAVRDGRAKITAAVELSKLSKDQQKQVLQEAKGKKVAGKERIKVSDVKAVKEAAKAPDAKKAPPAPKPIAPAPKVTSTVYETAENMAQALEAFREDATGPVEKKVWDALAAYRTLVPLRKSA